MTNMRFVRRGHDEKPRGFALRSDVRVGQPGADAVRGMADHVGLILPAAAAVGAYGGSIGASALARPTKMTLHTAHRFEV
jgi:hypothetical protein